MEKSDLVDLIPLYVTGKVSDEQKAAIERELPNSKELREEFAFWRAARVVARKEAAYSAAGHLMSEQIVDYARGMISNPLEKLEIQQHLQACKLCSEDLGSIESAFFQPTPVPSPTFSQRLIQELTKTVRSVGELLVSVPKSGSGLAMVFRPIHALPLVAVLVVSGIIIYQMASPKGYPFSFALQFQTQERSPNASELQTLILPQKVSVLHLSIPIPHATLQPALGNITLTLSPPDEKQIHLIQGLSWSVGSDAFDTAKVEIPASALHTTGSYSLLAAIKYTPTSQAFEYSYRFNVEFTE